MGKVPTLEHAPLSMAMWAGSTGAGDHIALGDAKGGVTVSALVEHLHEDKQSDER